jgi:hypothetical protein
MGKKAIRLWDKVRLEVKFKIQTIGEVRMGRQVRLVVKSDGKLSDGVKSDEKNSQTGKVKSDLKGILEWEQKSD